MCISNDFEEFFGDLVWGFDGFAPEEVDFAVCFVIGEDGVEFFNQLEAPVGPVFGVRRAI